MTDMRLNILISAQNNAMSVLSALPGPLGLIAGATVGIGIAAVKSAADFQQAMLSNVAHAGLAQSQFDAVSQSVMNMSTQVGRSPTQLAEALYPILSAFSGIQNQSAKSAIALDTLKMSFQTVAGTTVDGTAVANAAVGTFNALGLSTDNVATNTKRMTGLFDIMDKTVQLGNMQWDAYKNVVSKLAVSIQGTSVTFNESQAALAQMTNEGFSAQRASTYLSNTFTTLAIKTDALAKHAAKLGISFDEAKYGPMTLAEKIEYLNKITDGNKQKLLALMGNNSTALKTFNALSAGLGGYKSNLDALNHSQGALASSFDTASQGFNFQMQQLKASLDVLLISLGNIFLPIVTKIAAAITPVITGFAQWIGQSGVLQGIMQGLGGIFSWVASIFTGLDLSGLNEAWKNLTMTLYGFITPFMDVGNKLSVFAPILDSIKKAIQGVIGSGIQRLTDFIWQLSEGFTHLLVSINADPVNILKQIGEAFMQVFGPALNLLPPYIDRLQGAISATTQAVQPFMDAFDRSKGVIMATTQAVGPYIDRLQGISGVIDGTTQHLNPFTAVFQHLGAVITPVAAMLKDDFIAALQLARTIFDSVWSVTQDLIPVFMQLGKVVGGDVLNGFKQIAPIIAGQFQANLKFLGQTVQQVAGWFHSTMLPAIQQAMPGFEKLASVIFTQLIPALVKIWGIGQEVGRTIITVLIKAFETFEPIIVKIAGLIAGWLAKALQFLIPYVVQAAKEIGKFAADIATRAMPIITQLGQVIGVVVDWISQHWQEVWDTLAPYVMGAFNGVKGVIQIAWAVISGIFKIALDLISGNWGQAWNDMKDMLHGVWDGIVSIFKGGIDIVIGMLNGMIGGLNGMGIDIGPVHIHPNIPKIPLLASGGYIESTGLAFLHAGEQVIPANVNRSQGSSSGGGHIFNIYANHTDMRALAEMIKDEIANEMRTQGVLPTTSSGGKW